MEVEKTFVKVEPHLAKIPTTKVKRHGAAVVFDSADKLYFFCFLCDKMLQNVFIF